MEDWAEACHVRVFCCGGGDAAPSPSLARWRLTHHRRRRPLRLGARRSGASGSARDGSECGNAARGGSSNWVVGAPQPSAASCLAGLVLGEGPNRKGRGGLVCACGGEWEHEGWARQEVRPAGSLETSCPFLRTCSGEGTPRQHGTWRMQSDQTQ